MQSFNYNDNSDLKTREVRSTMLYVTDEIKVNRRFVWPGHELNTGINKPYDVTVRDGRELEDSFNLDIQGFQLAKHTSSVTDFYDNKQIVEVYAKEIADLVKQQTGADLVTTTNWMVRTSRDLSDTKVEVKGYTHNGGIQPVAGEVHVDTNQRSSEANARKVYARDFPDQPPYKRCIVMSNWRTFSPPPQDWPLAVCDYRSLSPDEGIPNTLVVTEREPSKEEQFKIIENEEDMIRASIFQFNPNHRWWYFSNMQADEVLMFKFFDSDQRRAWRVPHTAFFDPSFGSQANTRESIEVRTVAYFL